MITNETTINQSRSEEDVISYRQPDGLQQRKKANTL